MREHAQSTNLGYSLTEARLFMLTGWFHIHLFIYLRLNPLRGEYLGTMASVPISETVFVSTQRIKEMGFIRGRDEMTFSSRMVSRSFLVHMYHRQPFSPSHFCSQYEVFTREKCL